MTKRTSYPIVPWQRPSRRRQGLPRPENPALRRQRAAILSRMAQVSAAMNLVVIEGVSTGYAVDLLDQLHALTHELETHLDSLHDGLAWSTNWRRNA